jgi:hypothetical protein
MSASSMKLQTETFTAEKVDPSHFVDLWDIVAFIKFYISAVVMYIILPSLVSSQTTSVNSYKKIECKLLCVSHRKQWQPSSRGRLSLQQASSTTRNTWQHPVSPISPSQPRACAQSHPPFQQPHRYIAARS